MSAPVPLPPIAGTSGAALRRAHIQRLMAFAIAIAISSIVLWESVMSSWTTRAGLGRVLGDSITLLAVIGCHGITASSRYLISDASAISKSLLPTLWQSLATVATHTLVGMALGLCAWKFVLMRAGPDLALSLAEGSGARGGLVAGSAICSACSAAVFLATRKHQLRFGVSGGGIATSPFKSLGAFLWIEICGSLKAGFLSGVFLAVTYLLLRLLSDLAQGSRVGRLLTLLLGLPATDATGAATAGRLLVGYMMFLSAVVNYSLHDFLSKIMNAIITAPQDFMGLWAANNASIADHDEPSASAPTSPAAMLLEALSVGYEDVLRTAERNFIQDRKGSGGRGMGGEYDGGSALYKRAGSVGEWPEEIELQRRALALAAAKWSGDGNPVEAAAKAGDGVGWANGEQSGITVGLPLWAQVSRVQALQSLALRAPRDKKLRSVVYDVNIGQMLRTLCLQLDTTTLLTQSSLFLEDARAMTRSLGCEGRSDVQWLVHKTISSCGSSSSGSERQWLQTLKDGLTPPFRDTLVMFFVFLRPIFGGGGNSSGGRREGERGRQGKLELSSVRIQSAIWAAQALSALMVSAPGESRMWPLDAMLPVVLGSLAGLLLAVQPSGGGEETAAVAAMAGCGEEVAELAATLERAISEISIKYRSCLPDFRFPPSYADTINRLCSL